MVSNKWRGHTDNTSYKKQYLETLSETCFYAGPVALIIQKQCADAFEEYKCT